jgi:hypothetical protein
LKLIYFLADTWQDITDSVAVHGDVTMVARYGHCGVSMSNNRMLVFGGVNNAMNSVNDVWLFDLGMILCNLDLNFNQPYFLIGFLHYKGTSVSHKLITDQE